MIVKLEFAVKQERVDRLEGDRFYLHNIRLPDRSASQA